MQAEVGEAGSEEHARRERLLRAAIELRSRITLAQDRYGVLRSLLPKETHVILPVDKVHAWQSTWLYQILQSRQIRSQEGHRACTQHVCSHTVGPLT